MCIRDRFERARVCCNGDTQHLDRPGQLAGFELESNTDSHSARSKAQVAHPDEKARQSNEQSSQHTNPSVTRLKHRPGKAAVCALTLSISLWWYFALPVWPLVVGSYRSPCQPCCAKERLQTPQQGGTLPRVPRPLPDTAALIPPAPVRLTGEGWRRFLPQLLEALDATGGRCEPPAVSQASFWAIVQLQVAKGAFGEAQALLASHWLAGSPPENALSPEELGLQVVLGQVDSVLRGATAIGVVTGDRREAWLRRVHVLLANLKVCSAWTVP